MKNNIYVTKSSMPSKEEYFKEIEDLWNTHILTNMGEKHGILEEKLKKYLDIEYISLFSNGHMALELVLQAMELKGEVITTPFTFASTTHAIVRNGLTPVFCDINEEDYTINVSLLESLITERTCAIVPVHVYGNICDVDGIQEIADRYGLKVIYDAAHAFGEWYKGKSVVNYGDASMLSFHATKVFNTIEGGAICYKEDRIGTQLYKLKNFGIKSETIVDGIGANAKMNEFQAAMGICNLRYVDGEIEKRKRIVQQYRQKLSNISGLKISKEQDDTKSNYAYFPIWIDEVEFGVSRDELYLFLQEEGVFTRKYFYPLTSNFECYKGRIQRNSLVVAEKIANGILTLPLYADLREEEVTKICELIIGKNKA